MKYFLSSDLTEYGARIDGDLTFTLDHEGQFAIVASGGSYTIDELKYFIAQVKAANRVIRKVPLLTPEQVMHAAEAAVEAQFASGHTTSVDRAIEVGIAQLRYFNIDRESRTFRDIVAEYHKQRIVRLARFARSVQQRVGYKTTEESIVSALAQLGIPNRSPTLVAAIRIIFLRLVKDEPK